MFTGITQSCTSPTDYLEGGTGITECGSPDNFFDDPLYEAQSWVYRMINLEAVWSKGYFGENIRVRVNDDGVDFLNNKEFEGRYNLDASCQNFAPLSTDRDGHGTTVAGIVAGNKGNKACAVGIAPLATLSSCNMFSGLSYSAFAEKLEMFDVSQNSFGLPSCGQGEERRRELQSSNCPFTMPSKADPCTVCDFSATELSLDCEKAIIDHCRRVFEDDDEGCIDFLQVLLRGGECNYDKLPPSAIQAITKGITEGRDGKGVIYVFASGNGYAEGDDVNFGGLTNTRFTISVGAVGKNGLHASYSTPGSALFISGPGGDKEDKSKHMSAGLGGKCADSGPGTSFACPVVSGVIALMLEANPSLTWRDVQGILAATSQPVTIDPDDDTAMVNGAGVWHSNFYGFGIIDADAAVAEAETWELLSKEEMIISESALENIEIKDDGSTVLSTITIPADKGEFAMEGVEVLLDLQHFSRGDLLVVLTSPQKTTSILHPGKRPENQQPDKDERWKLLTVRNWGEKPAGDWTLQIQDLRVGDFQECQDAPFYQMYEVKGITCPLVESEGWCKDGILLIDRSVSADLLALVDNDLNIEGACCACGGGHGTNDSTDLLRQWRLVIYGRLAASTKDVALPTQAPSSPQSAATLVPTSSTTKDPAGSPSASPATSAPSPLNSTASPTASPALVSPTTSQTPQPPTVAPSTNETGAQNSAPSKTPATPTLTTSIMASSAAPTTTPSIMATRGRASQLAKKMVKKHAVGKGGGGYKKVPKKRFKKKSIFKTGSSGLQVYGLSDVHRHTSSEIMT
jgi:hypothetical protein